jgi:hypothetical protein
MVLLRIAQRFTSYFKQKPTELGRWSLLESSEALQKRIEICFLVFTREKWVPILTLTHVKII